MRKVILIMLLLSITLTVNAYSEDGPKCTQGEKWQYVINNAYRIADDYATYRNPRSDFFSLIKDYSFVKQVGGEYKGNYLLLIRNEHEEDISFAVLLPLFDVDKPSDDLDDTKPLWKVVSAKLNGIPY